MEQDLTSRFPTPVGLEASTPKASSVVAVDASKCETRIQLGIFFDGTDNNLERDSRDYGDTNIVRLFHSYSDVDAHGTYKLYIPGVGTIFERIGEMTESGFGNAFGSGGYARILFALLWTLNAISKHVCQSEVFTSAQIRGLCNSDPTEADIAAIHSLGVGEPLTKRHWSAGPARSFLDNNVKKLFAQVSDAAVTVKECVLDVFGFSRGAAEARVFCHWIDSIAGARRVGDAPLSIRFLGLFDTVASVGVWHSIGNAMVNSTGGHVDWARPEFLRINSNVGYCVHMVAMHELRKNFPLDEVSLDGVVPPNCIEVAYPGAHSDVGGGYRPGQLGVATAHDSKTGDSRKLSQITLRDMFKYARSAGVPILKREDTRLGVHPDVENAVNKFYAISGSGPKKLSDWAAPYLAWRWQVRKHYLNLAQVKNATAEDRELLVGGNASLVEDATQIYLRGEEEKAAEFSRVARLIKKFDLKKTEYRQGEIAAMDPEAPHVLACAKAHPLIPAALAEFFDLYVHDSLAGFRKDLKEPTGYWRYRRSFRGSDVPELTQNDEPSKMPRTA